MTAIDQSYAWGKISYKMIINKINKIIVLITQAYLREIQFAQQ